MNEPVYISLDEVPAEKKAEISKLKRKHRQPKKGIKQIVYKHKSERPSRRNSVKYKKHFKNRPNPK